MWKKLIVLLFIVTWPGEGLTRHASRRRNVAVLQPIPVNTFFDRAYPVRVHRGSPSGMWKLAKDNSHPPTQRPIIRYWNSLLRNVRLSMPTITWNITNPFTNLFNGGTPNLIETPVSGHYDYEGDSEFIDKGTLYTGNVKRRKSHKKHKKTKKHRTTHRKPEHYIDIEDDDDNNALEEQINFGGEEDDDDEQFHRQHQHHVQSPYLLRPYEISEDPNKAVLYFDPHSGQYYEVQSVRSQFGGLQVRIPQLHIPEKPETTDIVDGLDQALTENEPKLEDIKGTLTAVEPADETLTEAVNVTKTEKQLPPPINIATPTPIVPDIVGKTRSAIDFNQIPFPIITRSQETHRTKQGMSTMGRDAGAIDFRAKVASKKREQKPQWYFFVPNL